MKKRFLYFILVFVLMVFVIPYIMGLPVIRPYVEKSVSQNLNISLKTEKINWSWFPSPHITIFNSIIHDEHFSASIKDLVIFPNLPALFRGGIEVKKIEIDTPEIRVKTLQIPKSATKGCKNDSGVKGIFLPSLVTKIKNGHLALPVDGFLKELKGRIPAPEISDINIDFTATPSEILVNGSFIPGFAASVSSRIKVTSPSAKTCGEYFWELDIRAKEIDLGKVRERLLQLLPENQIVKDVCNDIIKGGRAGSAEYKFQGKTSEFGHLDQMLISAIADKVKVHIPGTDIYLTNASGIIKIENSILSGQGLSAQLGSTEGKNCNLKLGLGDSRIFNLDLDINADLSDLLPVLENFIKKPETRSELEKISGLKGKAMAHLNLGDDLRDIQVNVDVSEVSASFYYDLLKRQLKVLGGKISFNSNAVKWNKINGMIGPNTINNSGGSINLGKEIFIDIQSLDATLNTKDVRQGLMTWPLIAKELQKILSDIDGFVRIKDFKLTGPVDKPEKIKYSFTTYSEGLRFLSPLVSRPVTTRFANMKVSDKSFLFDQSQSQAQVQVQADIMGQTLNISGNLQHKLWQNFEGLIRLEGDILKSSEEWLKEKGWIPEMVFPALPCRIEPLKIILKKHLINISGNIIHPDHEGGTILTYVDVDILNNRHDRSLQENMKVSPQRSRDLVDFHINKTIVKKLEIKADYQHAVTAVDYIESKGNIGLSADFKGKVSGEVLNKILERVNNFPNSYVEGDCRLISPLDPKGEIKFTGNAGISGISRELSNGGRINIGNASITGKKDRAILKIKGLEYIRPGDTEEIFTHKIEIPELEGDIYFNPGKKALVKILSGNLCGINISGDILLPTAEFNLVFKTDKNQTITCQDFLSCLGITRSQITGAMTLNAELKGRANKFNAGHIDFRAKKGLIKKATLLTRILSLIDIAEFFSQNPVKHFISNGYSYDSIAIDAVIAGNTITITRAEIYGEGLNFFATGSIDIETWQMDLVILAAPFTMIDNIITSLPIVGKFLGGENQSVISVPLKAKGPVGDPEISIIPAGIKAVSEGILDTFKTIFKIPFNFLYKPVNSSKKSK